MAEDLGQHIVKTCLDAIPIATRGDYALARERLEPLLQRTRDPSLHPDYHRFVVANLAYITRKTREDPREALPPLLEALARDDGGHATKYFGSARISEEIGLVHQTTAATVPGVYRTGLLEQGKRCFGRAKEGYDKAIVNEMNEIVPSAVLADQRLRAGQVLGATLVEYAMTLNGERRTQELADAVAEAREVIMARERRGERSTFNLMDAYHTLAFALGEQDKSTAYPHAIGAYQHALSIATANPDMVEPAAVIHLRLAELYEKSHAGVADVTEAFDAFLKDAHRLPISVRRQLRSNAKRVAASLGRVDEPTLADF